MKLRSGIWWALLDHPSDLPCLFEDRRSAVENRCPEEYLVRVRVEAISERQRLGTKAQSGVRRLANRTWHAKRVARGLCATCGKPNPRHPKWYCEACKR